MFKCSIYGICEIKIYMFIAITRILLCRKNQAEHINQSNVIALQIFHHEIEIRDYLWMNVDIYNIMMRQIVIYYTMTNEQYGYAGLKNYISLLNGLQYLCPYFSCCKLAVAKYYRLWNFVFYYLIV